MNRRGRLTVCVTTYNRWDSCLETLRALRAQTEADLHIILVDDFSDTAPPEHIMDYVEQEGIEYIRNPRNLRLAGSRNVALSVTRSEFFSFCDDDDIWPRDLAERLLKAMAASETGVGLALADRSQELLSAKLHGQTPRLKDLFLLGVTPPVSSQIYHSSLLQKIGGYNERVKSGVDHDLWINLLAINPYVCIVGGGGALACSDMAADRMTLNEAHRRENIAKSLVIWEPAIVRELGEDFFDHFCRSYERHLNYGFFVRDVRRGAYTSAFKRLFAPHIVARLVQRMVSKCFGKHEPNAFPPFAS